MAQKENIISYLGIRTHNLKGIDLLLEEHSFVGVSGPSGSGQTSLAYGTVYAIAQEEWGKINNQNQVVYKDYEIENYEHIKPTIALKQDNQNVNPRSLLASFLHVDREFRLLYSIVSEMSPSLFTINNPGNSCPYCEGLGLVRQIDPKALIDETRTLLERPFVLLSRPHDQALLLKYAEISGIPCNIPFSKLTSAQQYQLLYGQSDQKYQVRYKLGGKMRTHSFYYVGYLDQVQSLERDQTHISSAKKLESVQILLPCSHCQGKRFSEKVLSYRYRGFSIGDLYALELDELSEFLAKALLSETAPELCRLLQRIQEVIQRLVKSDLGYLSLNRSIPTLSGGELQRVQLARIISAKLSDILYIVDEPSASLHVSEYDSVLQDLKELQKRGNTILMVEHNPYFLAQTDRTIYLGPGAGAYGGELVDTLPNYSCEVEFGLRACNSYTTYSHISANNLIDVSIDIPEGRITGIYGVSGSGKTTLSRQLSRLREKAEYVSQKVLRGTKASTIASYSEVSTELRQIYAKNNALSHPLSLSTPECQCQRCGGKGVVRYSLDFSATIVDVICEDCSGMRYNEETLSLEYQGLNFRDLLTIPVHQLIELGIFQDHPKVQAVLERIVSLGLGYLSLSRTTDTLSGGESQRLKLIKALNKKLKGKTFIFDEPLKGLGRADAVSLMCLFRKISDQGATIILVEHSVLGLSGVDYVLELGPGKGKHGGKILFAGDIVAFRNSSHWEKYRAKGAV